MTEDTNNSNRLIGTSWFRLRDRVFKRDNQRCRNCSATANLVAHHVVPFSVGGADTKENLVTLCRDCHQKAHLERRGKSSNIPSTSNRYLLTQAEIRNILYSATHPLHRALILLLAKTGMGVGELCNLNLTDLDLQDEQVADEFNLPSATWGVDSCEFIRVRYAKNAPHNNRRERSATTYIPLDEETAHSVKRWLAIRPDTYSKEPLFVPTAEKWGTRLHPESVRHILQVHGEAHGLYAKGSELENFTPVSLRYFFQERFTGQPSVRDYILGKRSSVDSDFEKLWEHYRRHSPQLLR